MIKSSKDYLTFIPTIENEPHEESQLRLQYHAYKNHTIVNTDTTMSKGGLSMVIYC